MNSHLRYLSYVLRHKWFVMIECFKWGLLWRGITHDLDKFFPSMWFPYVEAFYGKKPNPRDNSGYYDARNVGNDRFMLAWLGHIHRNDHHWQHWILIRDDGGKSIFEMPDAARQEMVCDWMGAGKAQRKPDTAAWYRENRLKMQLHAHTRMLVEMDLGCYDESCMYWSDELKVGVGV